MIALIHTIGWPFIVGWFAVLAGLFTIAWQCSGSDVVRNKCPRGNFGCTDHREPSKEFPLGRCNDKR